MPAQSQSQRRLFGMVRAYQKGQLKHPSAKVKSVASHVSPQDAHDFAVTRHQDLPEKVAGNWKQWLLDRLIASGRLAERVGGKAVTLAEKGEEALNKLKPGQGAEALRGGVNAAAEAVRNPKPTSFMGRWRDASNLKRTDPAAFAAIAGNRGLVGEGADLPSLMKLRPTLATRLADWGITPRRAAIGGLGAGTAALGTGAYMLSRHPEPSAASTPPVSPITPKPFYGGRNLGNMLGRAIYTPANQLATRWTPPQPPSTQATATPFWRKDNPLAWAAGLGAPLGAMAAYRALAPRREEDKYASVKAALPYGLDRPVGGALQGAYDSAVEGVENPAKPLPTFASPNPINAGVHKPLSRGLSFARQQAARALSPEPAPSSAPTPAPGPQPSLFGRYLSSLRAGNPWALGLTAGIPLAALLAWRAARSRREDKTAANRPLLKLAAKAVTRRLARNYVALKAAALS